MPCAFSVQCAWEGPGGMSRHEKGGREKECLRGTGEQ